MFSRSSLCILALLIVCASCENDQGGFNVTVSCTPCKVACGFANCYKIESTLWSSQACGDDNCGLANSVSYRLGRCDFDFAGASCGTGLCYFPNNTGCVKTDLTALYSGQFTPGKWVQSSCADCQTTSGCSKCQTALTQGATSSNERCIGNSCNNIPTFNITVNTCSNSQSPMGNPCQNCYSLTTTSPIGVCTTGNPKFSSLQFNIYAKARTIYQKFYTLMSILVFFIMITIFN